eukprot:TRINITY_DN2772_c0_g1_i2.p3 TRINITY_DN2772_c0_g1~~TRINITY_DN2772_c0_g1_i2.p3  ORF type:complete len:127 (-),score=30.42 TRINITY_DN2772_c0_g1_i2:133-513(-)
MCIRDRLRVHGECLYQFKLYKMGKRKKSGKKQVKATKPKLETQFDCPACFSQKSVEAKLYKARKEADIGCRVCGANYHTYITNLSEPIDVYSEWIDECKEANIRRLQEKKVKTNRNADYDRDEESD